MGRPFPTEDIPWKDGARHGWLTSDIRRQASMRVRAAMEKLAQAHADWRGADAVTQEDVKAAMDVTWMTREGW
jgi:Mg-chelatase subunit ChlI